jgi:hypothetical protein
MAALIIYKNFLFYFNLDTFKKAVISLAINTVVGTYQELFNRSL